MATARASFGLDAGTRARAGGAGRAAAGADPTVLASAGHALHLAGRPPAELAGARVVVN